MDDLMSAVRLGMECRRKWLEYDATFKNPMVDGSEEAAAWQAGYENDLYAWMVLFKRAAEPASAASRKGGRFRAHDSIVFNAHTTKLDRGEFLGYAGHGMARVLLGRAGITCVPVVSLTRPERNVA